MGLYTWNKYIILSALIKLTVRYHIVRLLHTIGKMTANVDLVQK